MSVSLVSVGGSEPTFPLYQFLRTIRPVTVSWTGTHADVTLTGAQNAAGIIYATGTPDAGANIIGTPLAGKFVLIENSSGQTITFKAAGQTGVAVANGAKIIVKANSGATDFEAISTVANSLSSGGTLTDVINTDCKASTALTKTSDATLATVPGLSVALTAGGTYAFRATIPCTSDGAGGVKVAMVASGGLTATSINYSARFLTAAAVAVANATALAGALGDTAAVILVEIDGVIVVNAAGTLNVQFAQNVSDATASVALANGFLNVTRIA